MSGLSEGEMAELREACGWWLRDRGLPTPLAEALAPTVERIVSARVEAAVAVVANRVEAQAAACDELATLTPIGEGGEHVPRCQYVSPTPWGPSQCALPDEHDGRHAYSPTEGGE